MVPPHEPIADIGGNPEHCRTSWGKDGQLRHDMGERINRKAKAGEDGITLVQHHTHSTKGAAAEGGARRIPTCPSPDHEPYALRLILFWRQE